MSTDVTGIAKYRITPGLVSTDVTGIAKYKITSGLASMALPNTKLHLGW